MLASGLPYLDERVVSMISVSQHLFPERLARRLNLSFSSERRTIVNSAITLEHIGLAMLG